MYYPEGMKARVSPVQWSKPNSILAPTQDSNPGGRIQNHKRWPLHYHCTHTLPLHTWDMIFIWHSQDSNSQPVPSQGRTDSFMPQWRSYPAYTGTMFINYRSNSSQNVPIIEQRNRIQFTNLLKLDWSQDSLVLRWRISRWWGVYTFWNRMEITSNTVVPVSCFWSNLISKSSCSTSYLAQT